MNTQFKTKDYEITADVRVYAEEKLQTLVKYIDGADESDARFEVELSKDSKHHSGEVCRADVVALASGIDMHAVGHGETMQAAVDMARDDLARRLNRDVSKARTMLRRGSRAIKRMLRLG